MLARSVPLALCPLPRLAAGIPPAPSGDNEARRVFAWSARRHAAPLRGTLRAP